MTPEGEVKDKLKKMLKRFPTIYVFWPVQFGYGVKTLDCLICANGHFIAIEVKRKGKDPTPLQEKTLRDIFTAGGKTFVIDGTDRLNTVDEVYAYIKTLL